LAAGANRPTAICFSARVTRAIRLFAALPPAPDDLPKLAVLR
jgi:hypothetical protein